ncbi:hypothetical protein TNCV_3628521 [Trichonephila clavipes]|nr:hypothetical protein TNCV_3628521 [Trichonephila clavipes]
MNGLKSTCHFDTENTLLGISSTKSRDSFPCKSITAPREKGTKEWTAVKIGGFLPERAAKKIPSGDFVRLWMSEKKKRGNKRPSNEPMPQLFRPRASKMKRGVEN